MRHLMHTFDGLPIGATFWFEGKRTTVRGATYERKRGPYVKVDAKRYKDESESHPDYYPSRADARVRTTAPDDNRARVSTKPVDFGNGIRVVYLPVNQAWVVMWMDQIVRGPIPRHEAMTEAAQITGTSPSQSAHPRQIGRLANRAKAVTSAAEKFFAAHGGYARRHGETIATAKRRMARELAAAEAEGESRGWKVVWEQDPEGYDSLGDVDPADVSEVLVASLVNADGKRLEVLGGVVFGREGNSRNYGRVIEAELMNEALARGDA